MIILLDTSTPLCRLGIASTESIQWHEWQADRQLAKGLLEFVISTLTEGGNELSDITGIAVYKGPGSFTGLRIGLTVMNTLASSLHIPIIGRNGDTWAKDAVTDIQKGENDKVVLPEYGAAANITKPRK